jgi:hypothetical protein
LFLVYLHDGVELNTFTQEDGEKLM